MQLVVKTPSSTEQDFRLELTLAGTRVRDVKRLLQEQHPEHPEPESQRLIFAGKLLTDDALTSDVLKQARRRPFCPCPRLVSAVELHSPAASASPNRPSLLPLSACRSKTSRSRRRST